MYIAESNGMILNKAHMTSPTTCGLIISQYTNNNCDGYPKYKFAGNLLILFVAMFVFGSNPTCMLNLVKNFNDVFRLSS